MPSSQYVERGVLETKLSMDPLWTAYAMADLEQPQHNTWHLGGDAIVLIYRAFKRPVVKCMGPAEDIGKLLPAVAKDLHRDEEVSGTIKPDVLDVFCSSFEVVGIRRMLRMALDPSRCAEGDTTGVRRLGKDDLDDLEILYKAADPPVWFFPEMLQEGVYYGLYRGGSLASVAGTHVVAASLGIAAVGSVYTRRELRGRGYASRVVNGVTSQLVKSSVKTVVLNVDQGNRGAIKLYERAGYRTHCAFCDVTARPKL